MANLQKHLVMLHGWGLNKEKLEPLGALLSDQRIVHCLDLPGFGKTLPPEKAWNTKDYAQWLNDKLCSLGLEKVDLFGHSFGGKVASQFAVLFPEKLDKLILLSTSGLKRKKTFGESIKFFALKLLGKVIKKADNLLKTNFYQSKFVSKAGSKDYLLAGPLRPTLVRTLQEDFRGVFSKINAKTLLIWGEEDKETPLEMGLRVHKLIKKSDLISLKKRGHAPYEDVGAHLLAKYISQFLGDP